MSLRNVLRDRRVWLGVLTGLLAIAVGRFAVSPEQAVQWVAKAGYWGVFSASVLFACAVAPLVAAWWRGCRDRRVQIGAAIVIGVAGGVLLAHEKFGFKTLADEALLLGTAMDMHHERTVAYPIRATDIQGPFQILQNVVDKRPFFYPFLVSVAHDLTGYRMANAFYVNVVLGFVFLGLVYQVGGRIGGNHWAGILLVLLFAGLPVLAQEMKGGGFDLLNAVMLCTVLLLAISYAERRDERSGSALCLATVLLAYTRYESLLFTVPVAVLIVWGWVRENRVVITWQMIVAPLLLVFPLLQNRIFNVNSQAWETVSKGVSAPFSPTYVANNLSHALAFFFDPSGYQPNSPLFAGVGLLAVIFFLVWSIGVLRRPLRAPPAHVATVIISVGLLAVCALVIFYYWGQLDDPVSSRFSLPMFLLMGIALCASTASVVRQSRAWQIGCAVATASLVVYSLPVMSRRAYASRYSPAMEMEWRTEFLERNPGRDYLFLDNDSVFWIANHVASTPVTQARERVDSLAYLLRCDSFSSMFVMQHFAVDPESGVRTLRPADDLGPNFVLQPVWERRIKLHVVGRISRIVAIREGARTTSAGFAREPAEETKVKRDVNNTTPSREFIDQWLKQLP